MSEEEQKTAYRVLARKYRPSNFDDLIGHEAMVRTLSNALEAGRLAHAFVLTGTRGIGKTTTARIIARGLNCIGADGNGGPTVHPCGVCENCVAIAEDRHQDVLEMDAASRTGVDDIRELIDGVRYLPINARYKIYIIDEVHMLSKNAFNALLKTLEEPPEHVKFIFATTEIRKIPVTVLSRCQRFDLKRVDAATLADYFGKIAEKENASVSEEALALIARAAEGSVRDGLSLLDQAIAHGDGHVDADQARDMLGLADRSRMLDLLDVVFQGNIAEALDILRGQYDRGADPVVIIQDLLELTHWMTALKVTPEAANNVAVSGGDVTRGQEMAGKLSMPVLARTWQMLLKGLDETRRAPSAIAAAEMLLVRLTYASDLPSPGDLARQVQDGNVTSGGAPSPSSGGGVPNGGPAARMGGSAAALAVSNPAPTPAPTSAPRAQLKIVNDTLPEEVAVETPAPQVEEPVQNMVPDALRNMDDVVDLLQDRADVMLKGQVINFVRPVKFDKGYLEFSPAPGAPVDLAAKLGRRLREITGEPWQVELSADAEGAPTVAEKRQSDRAAMLAAAERHPLVQKIKDTFNGATVVEVRDLSPDIDMEFGGADMPIDADEVFE
ncbi:DNA polymerase III subunit gamma/tau [Sneathiella sp. P13V-1]|uniref:DNA polymerase III subunit gamma/tau n=1 Tax=Sneathiella sp. P13V-1 TaxID=2697366 RepID=UPI00187B967B|nr:DNA polymerase III subunit gamma/tau [Sneathiella sp. P13V-1]MBE7635432.1 DNA polymerase III subunit gamma/tau [Sneathiella sp. P13V-1]